MARVRLLVSMAGPMRAWNVGDVYECGAAEASRLVAAGYAVPIAEPTIERAVTGPAETRKRKGRG